MSRSGRFSLAGRTALVTGGAAGIGRAIADAFAEAGADVAVTVHRRPADAVREVVTGHGRRFAEVATDLSQLTPDGAEALLAEVDRALGPVDVLVNNAGIIRRAPAAETDFDDWRAVLRIDLDAVWLLSQAAGRGMLARGGGKIVTVASVLAFQGGVYVPAYASAKHALVGLTKALANEWAGRGVNVNAVAPGYVRTANTEALQNDPERSAALLARVPAGRWGEPDDIAGAAVFLASSAADFVHGVVLPVDGGWLGR